MALKDRTNPRRREKSLSGHQGRDTDVTQYEFAERKPFMSGLSGLLRASGLPGPLV